MWGDRGHLVESLVPDRCEFESRQGLWIEETTKLAFGTSVVLLTVPPRA